MKDPDIFLDFSEFMPVVFKIFRKNYF